VLKADSHIPCRSPAVLKADSHIPCRFPATTLSFSDSAVSFVKVPYLVHEVPLLSLSRNYLLLNSYHNLSALHYTSTHALHQNNNFFSSMTNVALFHNGHLHWDWYASDNKLSGTPRGSKNRPKYGRSPTCRLWMPMLIHNTMPFPCCSCAVTLPRPCHGLEMSLSERYSYIPGMAGERHGICELNKAALCKSNGKDTI
jgi:hypothetical protein